MRLKSKLWTMALLTSSVTALVIGGTALPSAAAVPLPPGSPPAVAALVAGQVNTPAKPPACTSSSGPGQVANFLLTAVAGLFVDGTPQLGAVAAAAGVNVEACVTPILVDGHDTQVINTGDILKTGDPNCANPCGTFTLGPPVDTVTGSISSTGSFIQAGTVAVANIPLTFKVNAGTAGTVTATAVLAVVPAESVSQAVLGGNPLGLSDVVVGAVYGPNLDDLTGLCVPGADLNAVEAEANAIVALVSPPPPPFLAPLFQDVCL